MKILCKTVTPPTTTITTTTTLLLVTIIIIIALLSFNQGIQQQKVSSLSNVKSMPLFVQGFTATSIITKTIRTKINYIPTKKYNNNNNNNSFYKKSLFVRSSIIMASASASSTTSALKSVAAGAAATTSSSSFTTDVCLNDSTSNPLLHITGLPKFASLVQLHDNTNQDKDDKNDVKNNDDGIVTYLTPAMELTLQKLDIEWNTLQESLQQKLDTKDTTITYDDVVPILEQIQYPLSYIWGITSHLNGVRNSDGLRKVYETNQPLVVQTMSKFQQSSTLYNALLSIQNNESYYYNTLNNEQRRAIELSIRSMKLGGIGLSDNEEQTKRFNDMKQRLASLSNTFSNNVLDATKAFSLTITDPTKLVNVPQSALDLWSMAHQSYIKQQQQKDGSSDTTETNETTESNDIGGPWRITLDMPSYMAVMQHVPDRTIRETVYRAYITRASEINNNTNDNIEDSKDDKEDSKTDDDKNNVPIIYEILQLRHEMANMLGYKNYAEMSLASKMAPSIASITELANLITNTALPAAQQELYDITKFAIEQNGITENDTLQPWDISYWSERYKELKFQLKEEETRPYFALPAVLDGMFALVERIFQIRVIEAPKGEVEVWHKDVQYFKVYDISNKNDNPDEMEQIAGFYLDPYSRPENKRGGAWMDVCIGKSDAVNNKIPVAYLTCNSSPPINNDEKQQPSLMTFREVETLFHEFGHGLQHMLTTVSVGDVAGINGIEWDAVEIPSQFMENWCYDQPTIYGFAKHWETQEPMPLSMFEKLKEQKTYNAGMMSCRQLLFGQLDLELHSNYNPNPENTVKESIFDVHRKMAEIYTPYNLPLIEDRFLCSFAHIFAGGYAAGYYSYKWAEVMSSDAFGAFEDVGLDNEDAIQNVGMKFRNTILSLGGSLDPMTVFCNFRGREPNPEALLRHNGLLVATK